MRHPAGARPAKRALGPSAIAAARSGSARRAFSACWLLLCLLPAAAAQAAIQASIDPPTVEEMQTARLTLRVVGSSDTESLDLSPLERDFEVLGTSTNSMMHFANGQMQSWVEYRINLRPKRTGQLQVPSLSMHGQSSPPLQLHVRPLAPSARDAIDRMLFFTLDISPKPVYVQAQAVLTRRLHYSSGVQFHSDFPGAPEIPDAVVLPLGEPVSRPEVRDGEPYMVLEQRYAIFPERSGQLRIPEAAVASSVQFQSNGRLRRASVRASAPETLIEVLPIPPAYPADQPWLPAREVTIQDVWEPSDATLNLGEAARRTLQVRAVGNTGSSIPPLEAALPEAFFKQYPEPVALNDASAPPQLIGSREQAYSVIPARRGTALLPELRLTWWDTANRQVRIATAPARQVRIAGALPSGALAADAQAATDAQAAPPESPAHAMHPAGEPEAAYPIWLTALAAFGFAGWLATYLLMRRRGKDRLAPPPDPNQADSWKTLTAACRQGDPKAMREAWIAHLGLCWQTGPSQTLAELRRHPQGSDLLQRLNRALYAPESAAPVPGPELLKATRALLKKPQPAERRQLPELHAPVASEGS